MTLYHFISASTDHFMMLSENDNTNNAEDFCKKYIPTEYECWDDDFDYTDFEKFYVPVGETNVVVPLGCGEAYRFDINDFELDTTYFSDEYEKFPHTEFLKD